MQSLVNVENSETGMINAKYQRIKEYLTEMSKDIDIKEDFIDRFAYNYANRGQWVSSEWIYEWFCLLGKTTRYNDFCSYYILKLKSSEFKQTLTESFSSEIYHGGQNKQVYEISQKGIKLIMLQADRKTREYYIELEDLMFDYIEKKEDQLNQTIQDKQQEVKQLQEYIEENKENYVIYEKEIIGENRKYRGLTNDIVVRNGQHRRRSCNPYLRKAFEQGKEVKTRIVKRFRSLSRNECKQIERDAILEIPLNERMNIRLPQVLVPQQQIDSDLTTIGENIEQLTYQELNDIKWEEKYQKCVNYKNEHGKLPVQYGQPEDVKKLAVWIDCMKQALKNKNRYKLTESRKLKILDLIKDSISLDEQWNQNYIKCLEFKQQNKEFPKKGSKNKKEIILAVWLLDCKRFLEKGKYNAERTQKMNILLEGYQTKTLKWDTQYNECLNIKQQYNRLPNTSEKKLYQWLTDQKTFLKTNDPRITEERRSKLNILFENLELKTNEQIWDEYYENCTNIMKNNQVLTSTQKSWISVQKRALDGIGYINDSRKQKIPELIQQYKLYKQK